MHNRTQFHSTEINCLKYHELQLHEVSGSLAYSTKAHVDIISADGDIVTADNNIGIYRIDRSMV